MDLEPIDRLISAWDERLRQVDENLLALESDSTYQLVSAAAVGRGVDLQGVTRSKVDQAIDAIGELFEGRRKLADVVEKARAARASISRLAFWSVDEKIAEIESLLVRPTIRLDLPNAPLSQRRLLGAASIVGNISAEQLLDQMSRGFDLARDSLLAVGKAWSKLDAQIDAISRDLDSIAAAADAEGLRGVVASEIDAASSMLDELRADVDRDPLGASADLTRVLAPVLEGIRTRVDAARTTRERARARLVEATSMLERWRAQRADAEQAVTELPLQFAGVTPRPLSDPSAITDHALWLDRLSNAVIEGHFHSAEVGLDRWFQSIAEPLSLDDAALGTLRSLTARRDDLLGRLSARRAQAESLVRRGMPLETNALSSADSAARLLAERPTPLADATAALEAFEAALASARNSPLLR